MINDAVETPDLSQNISNLGNDSDTDYAISTKDILLEAGYTSSEIKNAISHYSAQRLQDLGKDHPRTHVFSQGRTFTYEKLSIEPSKAIKKSKVESKKNMMSLAQPINIKSSAPNLDPKAMPFNPEKSSLNNPDKVDLDALTALSSIRVENLKNVTIGQLNINSLRNKIHDLAELMKGNLDILVITETKLDYTFPEKQFLIPGYKKPFRRDRNVNGGGIMIYVREDIPCDILLKHVLPENIEAIFIEINLRKNKLLLVGTYHSKNPKYGVRDEVYFKQIGLALDVYSSRFDKFLLAGDFNTQEDDDTLDEFLEDYHARNLVKDPTCFKSPENPSCIDLFITNSYLSFQKTTTVSTGLSDFHKMTVTVLKTTFPKAKPRIITYRTPYDPQDLANALVENLGRMNGNTYEEFEDAVTLSYDSVSDKKSKTLRANDKDFVTGEMRKAIMKRSQLENKKFKHGTEEATQAFKKHKNYCNRLRKRTRKDFYDKLDVKKITDNTKFWDTVCPLFSDKGGIRDKIVLVENDEIISESIKVAETFNDYFAGSADSLGITENKLLLNPVLETGTDVEKCIQKFEFHPSIISIKRHVQVDIRFEFSPITHKDIEREICALDVRRNKDMVEL